MRLRCLAAVSAALLLGFGQTARADLLIRIDKSQQQMTVSADGEQLYTCTVSTGRKGLNTPSGSYTPFRMDRHHFSEEWDNAPMPYSIFFTKQGRAIHGTYEKRHLGRAASHGCVRLSVKHAAILWKLVKEYGKKNPRSSAPARSPPQRRRWRMRAGVTTSPAARRGTPNASVGARANGATASATDMTRTSAPITPASSVTRRASGPTSRRHAYDRRYAEPPLYDRYDGLQPVFPFLLLLRPPGY